MRLQGQRPSLCLFCSFISTSTSTKSRALRQVHVVNASSPSTSTARGPSVRVGPSSYGVSKARGYRGKAQPLVPPGQEFLRVSLPSFAPNTTTWSRRSGEGGYAPSYRLNAPGDQFSRRLEAILSDMREELSEPSLLESFELDQKSFSVIWSSFEKHILNLDKGSSKARREEWRALGNVYQDNGKKGVQERLKFAFYGHMCGSKFTQAELDNQKQLADLRFPPEWFPSTRQMRRTIHLHVGPTNSGKTYHALQRLEQAESGVYAGPLRLLAHEIYTRLNAKGKTCGLVTGDERRIPEVKAGEVRMWSCTVEMTPLNAILDVAVIDEIQMINSNERGWAWTQAFLGVQAKEVHLCGEERTVPLIRQLAASIGDKLVVHTYERLSPLEMMGKSLDGDLGKLEKGDCIVSFSVMGIHALRKQIEKQTGRKVAIIYGSLPPETRAQQAKLFNDPGNEYDYLVASDAVGMGLNLSIKRVIFESATKHNGIAQVPLKIAEVKQIGGRAGRYRTAHQATKADLAARETTDGPEGNAVMDEESAPSQPETLVAEAQKPTSQNQQTVGIVTTLESFDYPAVEYAMRTDAELIKTAGIFPPGLVIERFASYFPPGTPFSYVLLRLNEISRIHPRYHLCGLKDSLQIADAIQTAKNLSITDRSILCSAPVNVRDSLQRAIILEFATRIGQQRTGPLLDIKQFRLELLDQEPTSDRGYLSGLETLHKGLVLYLWLSFRFPGVFTTRALAEHTKVLVENAIEHTLSQFSFTKKSRAALLEKRKQALLAQIKLQYQQNAEREGEEVQEGDIRGEEGTHEPKEDRDEINEEEEEDGEPPDVRDIITDKVSFQEDGSSLRDDYGEYPDPELESLKQHQRGHASKAP